MVKKVPQGTFFHSAMRIARLKRAIPLVGPAELLLLPALSKLTIVQGGLKSAN